MKIIQVLNGWIVATLFSTIDAINHKDNKLDNAEPMRLLRIERTNRLKECDWTQCPDGL